MRSMTPVAAVPIETRPSAGSTTPGAVKAARGCGEGWAWAKAGGGFAKSARPIQASDEARLREAKQIETSLNVSEQRRPPAV